MNLLQFLDYAGVAIFAATGALSASRKQLDIIGFIFFAGCTGVGGGTLRDLLLGASPVFWVANPNYIAVSTIVAILVFFSAHLFESRYRVLLWLDAAGLAAYSAMGAAKGLVATGSATVAIITGMLTATFGGILRDTMAGEPSVLLRPEIYVTAALAGSASFTAAQFLGLSLPLSAMIAVSIAFAVRGGALWSGWKFPPYKSQRGRTEEELRREGIVRPD